MKEQFLANEDGSRYAGDRSSFMSRDKGKDNLGGPGDKEPKDPLEQDRRFISELADQDRRMGERIKQLEELKASGFGDLLPENLKRFVEKGELPTVDKTRPGFSEMVQQDDLAPKVYKDQSGKTIVETPRLLPHLNAENAQTILEDLGLELTLPENWDKMPIVKRNKWLAENKGVYSFQKIKKADDEDLMLPVVAGGAGRFEWPDDDVTKEGQRVEDDYGRVDIKPVPASARISLLRLVALEKEIEEYKSKVADAAASEPDKVDEYQEVLDAHVKDYKKLQTYFANSLESAKAIAEKKIQNYSYLNDFVGGVSEVRDAFDTAGGISDLEKYLTHEDFELLGAGLDALNLDYRKKYDENQKRFRELFRPLEEEANEVNRAQSTGWYGRADRYRREFDRVANEEINNAATNEDRDMLRWRKEVLREGFDLKFSEISIRQAPGDWRDTEHNLDLIMRFLERTDFSDQQLSQALNAAAQIVQEIPVNSVSSKDRKEAEELQKRLTEKLQAILAVNSFYGAMEHTDRNPEKVLGILGSFKDDTFEIFFERFNRDSNGKTVIDKDGKEFNLLNAGMSVYMRRLFFERQVMNYVEQWTKNGGVLPTFSSQDEVRLKSQNVDIDELKSACSQAIEVINGKIGGNMEDKGKLKEGIRHWYRDYTLLGAHDEHTKSFRQDEMIKVPDTHGHAAGSHSKVVEKVWKHGIVEELRDKYGMRDEWIQEMLDNGSIEQVMNNAYRLSWMMAWTDYDGIRVWDPNDENPAGRPGGRVVGFVYNGSTHSFHGRMIDHAWEFFVDESRGKVPKTNYLMQDGLLGDYGNLLPQNRTMVRFAKFLIPDKADEYVDANIMSFKNIDKFKIEGGKLADDDEAGWAKSGVIGEGIDKGHISFEGADFAGMFNSTNSWKFQYIDLYSDRKTMMDFMGANALQQYLQQPGSERFFALNSLENFYSKREVRLQPWMKLAIPIHYEIGKRWKDWWKMDDRMTHAEKEAVIEMATASNRLNPDFKHWMKHKYLGWLGLPGITPVRGFREFMEAVHVYSREYGKGVLPHKSVPALFGGWTMAFFNQGFKYVLS